MANSLFERFGNQGGGSLPGPLGNVSNLLQQFKQFRSGFSGDPNQQAAQAQQQVQQLLNSGQMTQEQFNQLSGWAQQLQGLFH